MDPLSEKLLAVQNECTLCWTTQRGTPAATIVSFAYYDGSLWMAALEGSARVRRISAQPQCAIVISGKGTDLGSACCVSMQGICEIIDDVAERDRFFPAFATAVLPNSERGAARMAAMMNSPENLVLRFTPDRIIPYDASAAMANANQP